MRRNADAADGPDDMTIERKLRNALENAPGLKDARISKVTAQDDVVQLILEAEVDRAGAAALEQAAKTAAAGVTRSPVRVAVTAPSSGASEPRAPSDRPARRIIAVASGKGGVGKSTVAVNLAIACARLGQTVGLLDADIYGPSAPTLLGVQRPPEMADESRPHPHDVWGVQAMSIGFLVKPEKAVAWRGPMATRALAQLLSDTAWRDLDLMIIDMPPGTGDIQLSLAQRLALDGAMIVTTPNELALADARRAAALFETVRVPLLGLVENMSVVLDPASGARIDIYGEGGADAEATRLQTKVLARLPQTPALRRASDDGKPCMPGTFEGDAFIALATSVLSELTNASGEAPQPPKILIE